MSAQKQFESLGLFLPPAPKPMGVYVPCIVDGTHLLVSGHGPVMQDGTLLKGRVGRELDCEAGKAAAR